MADINETLNQQESQEPSEEHHLVEMEDEIEIIDPDGETQEATDSPDHRDTMIENLREGNQKLKAEFDQAQEELLRSRADYENLKRRSQRERFEEIKRAKKAVFLQFLQILDNFERALQTSNKDRDTFVQGIEMIHKQFIDTLSQEHVYEIQAKGTPFNPHMHEAMTQIPTVDVPENTVVEVFQKGYSFNGELLRPSQVAVSADPPEASKPETPVEDHGIAVKTDPEDQESN